MVADKREEEAGKRDEVAPGWLRYDGRHRPHVRKHKCVVVGSREVAPPPRPGRKGRSMPDAARLLYYVLVVVSTESKERKEYKRVGVGCVPSSCIAFREGGPQEATIL